MNEVLSILALFNWTNSYNPDVFLTNEEPAKIEWVNDVPYFEHIDFKALEFESLSLISLVQSKNINIFMRDYKNKLSGIPICSCKSFLNRDSLNWTHKDYHFSSCLLKNKNRLCFDGLLDIYNFMHDEMWILNLGENINNFRPLETKEKADLIVEERFPWKEFVYLTPYIFNPEFKDLRVSLYDFCLGYMSQSCENFTIDENLKNIYINVPILNRGSNNGIRRFELRGSNQLNDTFVETLKTLRQYVKILEEPNDPNIPTKNPLGIPYKYKNKYIILPL